MQDRERRRATLRLSALFGTIYFVQSIAEPSEGLVAQPVRSLLKAWGLSAGAIAGFVALLTLPWSLKPIFGAVSDFVPLLGWRRKSWLVAASGTASLGLIAAYLAPLPAGATTPLLLLLLLPSVGVAFADVLADALMVEQGKPLAATARLQSVQWTCIYAAGLLTGVAGGFLAERGLQRLGFLACGLTALLTLGATLLFVREPRHARPATSPRDAWRALRRAAASPAVLGVGALIFLWRFNPFSSTVLYLHLTQQVDVSEQTYGVIASVAALASMLGAASFGLLGHRLPPRLLVHASIALGVGATLSWWLVRGPRSALAIAAAVGFTGMVALLVLLDLAARACSSETAATVFATLMAASNLAMSSSTWLGGRWYQAWSLTLGPAAAFDRLVLVGAAFTASCWLLLAALARWGRPLVASVERPPPAPRPAREPAAHAGRR